MWDLRNSAGAVREFVGHEKGVLSMAWSAHDPTLLLSSAKDNRTLVWDVQSAEILCELPATDNWNFDIQWSPCIPGVFTTASYDGRINVTHLHACTGAKVTQVVNADFSVSSEVTGESTPLKRAPAWMRRPVGVTWGFGGRLVSFGHAKQSYTDQAGHARVFDHCTVSYKQVVTETEIVARSEAFENAIAGSERTTLRDYCATKTSKSEGEEGETWAFLSILFEEDGRRHLLSHLGFKDALAVVPPPPAEGAVDAVEAGVEAMQLSPDGRPTITVPGATVSANHGDAFFDDPNFFDNLPEHGLHHDVHDHHAPTAAAQRVSTPGAPRVSDAASVTEQQAAAADEAHSVAPSEVEAEIQKLLLIGNYESAVERCVQTDNFVDALLIANIAGADLFKRTMRRYMQRCPKPYTPVICAMMDSDYHTLVKTRPVSQWRDTLAVLATYSNPEQWNELCDALGNRLVKAGMKHAASLCFICAGNVENAVQHWARGVAPTGDVDVLQSVIEKAVIMGQVGNSRQAQSAALSDLVTSYASILAAQGRMSTALEYLEHVPGEASSTVAVLKDRIYRSGAQDIPPTAHAPPFPFVLNDVQPAPQQYASTTAPSAAVAAPLGHHRTPSADRNAAQYNTQYSAYGVPSAAQPQQQQQQPQANPYGTAATAAGYGGEYPAQSSQNAYNTAYTSNNTYAASPSQPYNPPLQASGYNAYGNNQYAQQQQQQVQQPQYNAQQQQQQQQQYNGAPQQQPQQQQQYAPEPAQVYQAKRVGVPPAPPPLPQAPVAIAPPPVPAQQPFNSQPAHAQQPPQQSYAPAPAVPMPVQQPQQQQQQPQQQHAYAPQSQAAVQQQYAPQPPQPSYAAPQAPLAYGAGGAGAPLSNAYTPQQAAPAPLPPAAPTSHQSVVQQPSFFVPTASSNVPVVPFAAAAVQQQFAPAAAAAPPPAAPASTQRPIPPPPPPGPPANISVQSADVSQVPPAQQPIIKSLVNLFNSCMPLANNPAKKREMDDNNKKLGQLFWRLNAGDVSEGVIPKLLQLCATVDASDWHSANHIQVQMTTTDWDECGYWLSAVKRLVKMRQTI